MGASKAAAVLCSVHQKAGSRMGGRILNPQLHEIGLKCRYCQVERAAELVDAMPGPFRNSLARGAVFDPRADSHRQLTGIGDEYCRAGAVKLLVDVVEI